MSLNERVRHTLRNVSIGKKLNSSFLSLCCLLFIVGALGMWGINQVHSSTNYALDIEKPKVEAINAAYTALISAGRLYRQAYIDIGTNKVAADVTATQAEYQVFLNDISTYVKMPHANRELVSITHIQAALQQYQLYFDDLTATIAQNTPAAQRQALVKINKGSTAVNAISLAFNDLLQVNTNAAVAAQNDANTLYARLEWAIAILMAVMLIIALFLGRSMTYVVATPLRAMAKATEDITGGNLQPLDGLVARFGGRDETGRLAHALSHMVDQLRMVVGRVSDLSQSVHATTEHIADASRQSSMATEQVANSIQRVAQGTTQQT